MNAMKKSLTTAVLAFSLLLSSAGLAQDNAKEVPPVDDIENAATPTKLLELLPEGGIATLDVDFYLAMGPGDAPGGGGEMVMRWSVKHVEDQLVFGMINRGGAGNDSSFVTKQEVYGKDGRLVSTDSHMRYGTFMNQQVVGKVVGDDLLIKTSNKVELNLPQGVELPDQDEEEVRKLSLKDYESSVPMSWMPLVFAYHIREGNLGYTFSSKDYEQDMVQHMTVEEIGIQPMELGGKQVETHVLKITTKYEFEDDVNIDADSFEQQMNMHVLADGTIVKIDAKGEQVNYAARYLSPKEGEEKFAAWEKADQEKAQKDKGDADEDVPAPAGKEEKAPAAPE